MGAITSKTHEGLGTVTVPAIKPLHWNTIRGIRKRWRAGYMVWAIAREMGLTEWVVAKQLKADGVKMMTLTVVRNRKQRIKHSRGEI